MKKIKAYIKPHKLSTVTLVLRKLEVLTSMSVVDVSEFGRDRIKDAAIRIIEDLVDCVTHVKIGIVRRDELVEEIISVIEKTAHTGLRGDGNIFAINV